VSDVVVALHDELRKQNTKNKKRMEGKKKNMNPMIPRHSFGNSSVSNASEALQ